MIILVDINSTITNFSYVLLEENNKWHNKIHTYNEITTYNWFEQAFSNPWEPTNHRSFWTKVSVNPKAKETLESFVLSGHKVYLVSASHYNDCLGYKIQTTLGYFNPDLINKSNVIIAKDKTMIKGEVLIDGFSESFKHFSGLSICYSQPWNKDFNTDKKYFLKTNNWNLIQKAVELYYKTLN